MIVVLGSINIDLTFQLEQLPSVGETALTPNFTDAIGGKGANQAIAARRDGADTIFVGCIGEDDFGQRAKAGLHGEGINVEQLVPVAARTGLASIWIDTNGDNMIAVASGANGLVSSAAVPAELLTPQTLVVLQMEIPVAETEAAITRAKQAGANVLLNLAPARAISVDALKQVDILVVNEHEAATLCEQLSIDAPSDEDGVTALSSALAATIITTLGSAGAIAVHEGRIHRVDALDITPVDTTGAGDCFVGVLAAGIDAGLAFDRALSRAAAAGSLACTVLGTEPSFPRGAEIDRAMASAEHD